MFRFRGLALGIGAYLQSYSLTLIRDSRYTLFFTIMNIVKNLGTVSSAKDLTVSHNCDTGGRRSRGFRWAIVYAYPSLRNMCAGHFYRIPHYRSNLHLHNLDISVLQLTQEPVGISHNLVCQVYH